MTWGMLAHNLWLIVLACVSAVAVTSIVYACAVFYNRAYMRLVKHYSQKEGTRNAR